VKGTVASDLKGETAVGAALPADFPLDSVFLESLSFCVSFAFSVLHNRVILHRHPSSVFSTPSAVLLGFVDRLLCAHPLRLPCLYHAGH
jgi:hypothetical protein